MDAKGTFIRKMTTVGPGGQIIVSDPTLTMCTGASVEVLIFVLDEPARPRQSSLDILNSVPGHVLFKSAEEVDQYLREERDSWDS